MTIDNVLLVYKESVCYNLNRFLNAKNGNIIEIINIGTDFANSGMFEYAFFCWRYVADLGKGNADVFSNLGVSYFYGNGVQQDYQKAVHYYQRAASLGHPFGMYNLAVACEQGKGTPVNMEKAVEFYRKAAEKGVNQAVDALIRLGLYDELNGFAFYARKHSGVLPSSNYQTCMDMAQQKCGMAKVEYGTLLGNVFKDEAIELFLKAISYNETSEAYFELASLYKDFKDYNNAIKYYKEAIRINPLSFEGYNDMGYCYYQMEDDIKALTCFKKSFDIQPHSMVLRNMGNCYKNLGEIEQSNMCYNEADMLEKR